MLSRARHSANKAKTAPAAAGHPPRCWGRLCQRWISENTPAPSPPMQPLQAVIYIPHQRRAVRIGHAQVVVIFCPLDRPPRLYPPANGIHPAAAAGVALADGGGRHFPLLGAAKLPADFPHGVVAVERGMAQAHHRARVGTLCNKRAQ